MPLLEALPGRRILSYLEVALLLRNERRRKNWNETLLSKASRSVLAQQNDEKAARFRFKIYLRCQIYLYIGTFKSLLEKTVMIIQTTFHYSKALYYGRFSVDYRQLHTIYFVSGQLLPMYFVSGILNCSPLYCMALFSDSLRFLYASTD